MAAETNRRDAVMTMVHSFMQTCHERRDCTPRLRTPLRFAAPRLLGPLVSAARPSTVSVRTEAVRQPYGTRRGDQTV